MSPVPVNVNYLVYTIHTYIYIERERIYLSLNIGVLLYLFMEENMTDAKSIQILHIKLLINSFCVQEKVQQAQG